MNKEIKIRGARTHNLKNVDLDLPRDKLIVITGLSGSGKSSPLAYSSRDAWRTSQPSPMEKTLRGDP